MIAVTIPFARKRPVTSTAIGLCFVLLLISLFSGASGGEDSLATYPVTRGDFLVSIVEGGILKAVNEVTVRNEVDGNSRIIYIVPEGTVVKKGDLIAQLDTAEAEKDLNEALLRYEDDKADFIKAETDVLITRSAVESDVRKVELKVKFAEMDLQRFEEIEKDQEIRNAQINIITAQESLKLAEERLEWSEKLTEEGFETKSNLDRDKLAVTNQKLGLERAKSVKKMLSEYDLAKMEAEYRSLLEEARRELERVKQQGDSKILQAQSNCDTARRKLGLSEDRLAKSREQLAATEIHAPQDGMIVYAMNGNRFSNESMIEEGAVIRQRQAIVKIPDTSAMKVEVKVHESHVNQVLVGQQAFVVLDSLPDKRFSGQVSKIAVLPDAQSRFGNASLKVYSTEILITEPLPDIKPGASARAEIIITKLHDVLVVPIQCVTTVNGKQICHVNGIGGPKPVEVEIGLFNNRFIEIKSGLEASDRVLLSPPIDSSRDIGGALVDEDENVEAPAFEEPDPAPEGEPDRNEWKRGAPDRKPDDVDRPERLRRDREGARGVSAEPSGG